MLLYLELKMGAAGDMLTAALYELLDEQAREGFIKKVNSLGLPGVEFRAERAERCGICGTYMRVCVNGAEEGANEHSHDEGISHSHDHVHDHHHGEHDHGHHHHDEHEHTHAHHGLDEIYALIDGLNGVSEKVRRDVKAVYELIADAESAAHGRPVSDIHFHEVGTLDALADVTAVCMLIEALAPERVVASPVNMGGGCVKCAHGILPVPAPATAHILRGIPSYCGVIESELCTPTGAALIKHFASEFTPQPKMTVQRIGYGVGKKEFEAANCVRAFFGESMQNSPAGSETVIELTFDIDDMTAEQAAYAAERILKAGALDVYTTPVVMKKGRSGLVFTVLCCENEKSRIIGEIFRHTSTIGLRENRLIRHTLSRRVKAVETPLGPVRIKVSSGFGVKKAKLEYDDLARIAAENGLSLDEVVRRVDEAMRID